MSLVKSSPHTTNLAVYDGSTGVLQGTLRMCLLLDSAHIPEKCAGDQEACAQVHVVFRWNAAPGFVGNQTLFPLMSEGEVPPFLADFVSQFKGEPWEILEFALKNHSGSQSALTLLSCEAWETPSQELSSQLVQELTVGHYVPARVLERYIDRIPYQWQENALSVIRAAQNSAIAYAMALDKKAEHHKSHRIVSRKSG